MGCNASLKLTRMAKKKHRRHRRKQTGAKNRPVRRKREMILSVHNYTLMAIGVVAIVVGYALMRLDNEVDGFMSLYVAPIIILGGYLEFIYAILAPKR